ncbi:acyltransferase 3 [Novosphingobium pentaromativorans US6-1]|uniref:Acyltransferase 3 n=1 Tax=Novosphingobium pentaromativorans US6-1 TaxID=1088721 RepID=G6E8Y0_9SPHN|nr:acyltransferase 3 [Novosphingobium pentaromativorans US6-1]
MERLTRLDGLRGLAACGVAFLYHTQLLFAPDMHGGEAGVYHWFHEWGWALVDLFFLISGYIFAHVYLGENAGGGGQPLARGRLLDFAVARFARLYPLHLLTLLFCAAVFFAAPGNTPIAFGAHLMMLQAFVQPVANTFNGPSWSISVEVVCYVLFALGAAGGRRTLRLVTALAIVGALVHFLLQGRSGGPWVGDGLPRGLLGFFLGQVMWHCRARMAQTSSALLVCLLAFGLALDMGTRSSLLPLTLYAWPAVLLLSLRAPFMGSAPMQWLGDRSYGIYLIHMPVLQLFQLRLGELPGTGATQVVVIAAFAGTVLILADMGYRMVEQPARRAIRCGFERRRAGSGSGRTSPV